MKRVTHTSSLLALGAATALAAPAPENQDSLRIEQLNEVAVHAVRAPKDAPLAQTNIDRQTLDAFARTGQELPMLLRQTPSVVAAFDGGLGIGTGYLRIRGSADSRINVTLDGVPLNSPEDQCVFWANMNSYAALVGSMQVQRGVGSSTNGDGAFGATIALTSKAPSTVPMAEVTASGGSYGTYVLGGGFSTGLLWGHLILDGHYTETNTDGYVHHTGARLGSYYGGLTWLGDGFVLRYKNFGNFEKTGQAWNGLDKADFDAGRYRYNPLNEYYDAETDTYTAYPYRTTDNFWQNHNILTGAFQLTDQLELTATLHYTHGYGYYKEWRGDNKLKKFGLNTAYDADGSAIKTSDFIRKKGLDQDLYGALTNLRYKGERWDAVGGLAAQQFKSGHFGHLTYIKPDDLDAIIAANPAVASYKTQGRYTYYDSDADKLDANVFARATYRITDQWSAYADVQYRYVDYSTSGINDKFYEEESGLYNQELNIDEQYSFLNPKAGLSWRKDGHTAYASFALSHREPSRNNFTDNGGYGAPRSEALLDYEAGYQYTAPTWSLGAGLYFMDYDNQLVQTGAQSDIGEALTTNIKDSYRLGVEITASWDVAPWLNLSGNIALSQNKIKDFDEVVEDWDDWDGNTDGPTLWHTDGDGDGYRTIHYDKGDLAFSPSLTAGAMATFRHGGWLASWSTNWVGEQYLDNTSCKDRTLPAYSTTDLALSHTWTFRRGLKALTLGATVNNLFNKHYAPGGGVYSAINESDGYTPDQRYTAIWLFPMAGTTAMGNVTLKF